MSEFRVYRNLHHADWTILAWQPRRGWRKLVGLTALWTPHDVEFTIGKQARESVRKNKRKQVHAYAEIGAFQLVDDVKTMPPFDITYTPYDDLGFRCVQDDGENGYSNLTGCGNGTLFWTDGHIYSQGVRME